MVGLGPFETKWKNPGVGSHVSEYRACRRSKRTLTSQQQFRGAASFWASVAFLHFKIGESGSPAFAQGNQNFSLAHPTTITRFTMAFARAMKEGRYLSRRLPSGAHQRPKGSMPGFGLLCLRPNFVF
jgi:hypothetical protein